MPLRQARVTARLKRQYPGATIIEEAYLRTATRAIAHDPITGKVRILDQVVIMRDRVRAIVETTSLGASKGQQIARQKRIRAVGGNFILDPQTGHLVNLQNVKNRVVRID